MPRTHSQIFGYSYFIDKVLSLLKYAYDTLDFSADEYAYDIANTRSSYSSSTNPFKKPNNLIQKLKNLFRQLTLKLSGKPAGPTGQALKRLPGSVLNKLPWPQKLRQLRKDRKLAIFFSGLLLILAPVAFLILRNPKTTEAAWWNSGWLYRRSIVISYSGSTTLTNFQVELDEVDVDGLNAAGKLQSACQDLRFITGNGQDLEYWVEDESTTNDTLNCTSSDFDIWVKVPSIPNGGTTIYMYYGNASANAKSNGGATFDMFDSFSTSTLSPVWDKTEDSISITAGNLQLFPTDDAVDLEGVSSASTYGGTNPTDNSASVITMKAKQTNTAATGRLGFSNTSDLLVSYNTDDSAAFLFDGTTGGNHETETANGGSTESSTAAVAEDNTWHDFSITWDGTNSVTFDVDANTTDHTSQVPNSPQYVRLENTDTTNTIAVDFIFVRKLATTPPTTPAFGSYGTEEIGPGTILFWKFDEGYGTTANDSSSSNNPGTITGAAWQSEDYCLIGKCLHYDGSEDYVSMPDNSLFDFDGSDSFTIQTWIRHGKQTDGSEDTIFSKVLTGTLAVDAVNIDDASNFIEFSAYFNDEANQILRDTDGTLYAILINGDFISNNHVEIWSSSDGSSWSQQDPSNSPSSGWDVSAAIDSNSTIHLLYTSGLGSGNIYYTTFDETFDTTPETLLSSANNYVGGSIDVDSSDVPHVVFSWGNFSLDFNIQYRNRVGGSWNTTRTIDSYSGTTTFTNPNITLNEDDIPEVIYIDFVDNDLSAAVGNQNNATSFTTTDIDSDVRKDAYPSIAVDANGDTWVSYLDENGATDYITLAQHLDGTGWTTWETPVTDSDAGLDSSLAVDGTDVYVLYEDENGNIAYNVYENGSSWAGEQILETDVDYEKVKVRWQMNNNQSYDTFNMDYIYSDSTDIWWHVIEFGVGGGGDESSANGYELYMQNDGDLVFGIDDDNVNFPEDSVSSTTANYDDSKWHMVTAVKDGVDSLKLYVDGELIDTDNSISATGSLATDQPLYVGHRVNISTRDFDGFIDETKVYPYARTQDQIRTDYTAGKAGQSTEEGAGIVFGSQDDRFLTDGLVGYWPMDETSGDASDSSGNDRTLTNNGTTTYVAGKYGNGSEHVPASSQYFNASSTIDSVKSISFWANPDNTTNYYLQLTDSAYLTSTSGTLSVSGFTDYTTYVNGVSSNTISADSWSLVTITTQTAIDATNFRVGYANSNYYDGTFDEFRLYNRTLSSSEVQALYQWAPGPVGYWKMDEPSGTRYDYSGNGNSLTDGNTVESAPGKFDKAGDFEHDNNEYLTITDGNQTGLDITGPMTFGAWVKLESNDNGSYIAAKGGYDANRSYWFYIDSSQKPYFDVSSDGSSFDGAITGSSDDIPIGEWHYYTAVYDGAYLRLYVDGVSVATPVSYSSGINDSSGDFFIGTNEDYSTYDMDGLIDDVKIYNYARTQQQIISDMNAGHPTPGSPVGSALGHWKFDEGYGLVTYDHGTGGNDGDLATGSNQPSWSLDGKYGGALDFDGNDYVTTADPPYDFDSEDFTITVWVNEDVSAPATSKQVVSKRSSTTSGYALSVGGSDEVYCQTANGSGVDNSNTATGIITKGVWTHLAIVRSGTSCLVYVNGTDKTTSAGTHDDPALNNNSLRFGSSTGGSEYWYGQIDDVRIYSSALTASQIALVYNQAASAVLGAVGTDGSGNVSYSADRSYCPPGDTTSSCGPVGEWKLDENQGTTAYDTTGNGYDGTLGAGDSSPSWAIGKIGPALKFDGSNDYVDIGTGPTSVKTVEFWAYPLTTTEYFVNITGSSEYIWANSGTVTATGFSTPRIYVDGVRTTSIVANKWQHIAVTSATAENASNLDIGRTTDSSYMEGRIDNLRLYDYDLSQEQVAWNYNRGGPIGRWKLDECEGTTAYDSSGKGNNGTITIGAYGTNTSLGTCDSGTGSEAWNNGTTGKFNYSLDFDGSDDYINMGNPASGLYDFSTVVDFSISAWVKTSGDSQEQTIMDKRQSDGVGYVVYVDTSGRVNSYLYGSYGFPGASGYTTATVDDGNWHFIVATYDRSANMNIYIDGVLDPQATTDISSEVGNISNSGNLIIGDGNQGVTGASTLEFKGQLDDVKLYNYVLTPQQIQNDMNQGGAIRFGPSSGAP